MVFYRKCHIFAVNNDFGSICFDRKLQKRVPIRIEKNPSFSTWHGSKFTMQLKNAWNNDWKHRKYPETFRQSIIVNIMLKSKPKHHVFWYTGTPYNRMNCVEFWGFSRVKFQ